jgi:uncharacterized protein (TIGR02001 family)
MKKILLTLLSLSALGAAPLAARAADEHTFSFNAGAVSDYRYRGISQSRLDPAIQGGIDYSHSSGFYVGTWASSIKWIKDAGGDADAEVDLYGGYKGTITEGFSYDVGVLRYFYPDSNVPVSPYTTEIYGALTYGPGTFKWSHSVTNLFGFADSKGSNYYDLSGTFDVGYGIMLTPHIGYQTVDGNSDFDYTDYSLTVGKDFSGFLLTAAIVGTDTKKIDGVRAYASPKNGDNLGKTALVVGAKYSF